MCLKVILVNQTINKQVGLHIKQCLEKKGIKCEISNEVSFASESINVVLSTDIQPIWTKKTLVINLDKNLTSDEYGDFPCFIIESICKQIADFWKNCNESVDTETDYGDQQSTITAKPLESLEPKASIRNKENVTKDSNANSKTSEQSSKSQVLTTEPVVNTKCIDTDDKGEHFEHNKNDQPDETLAAALKERGLSPKYWGTIFQDQGITSKEQFQYLDRFTFNKLLSKSKFTWERSALHKLIEDSKQDEILKQEAIIEKLQSKLPDTQKNISDGFQKHADRSREVFEDNTWLKQFDLDKVNDKLKKEMSGQTLIPRKTHQSSDLLRKIAAGQLLRGQFIYKDLETSSTYRRKLIEVDNSIELMLPDISETMDNYEFNKKEQSDHFESVLKQSGKSFAAAVYCGRFGFGITAHGSSTSGESEKSKDQDSSQTYQVIIHQLLNVPMASVTLSNTKVSLSECALKALQYLNDKTNKNNFSENCKLFFHEFGSHYYTGLCHFGGRYKWTVESKSESSENSKQTINMARLALNGSVSGGCSWFGGEIKGSYETGKEKVVKNRTFLEKCTVTKKLEKFGGPQEVDDIPLWKRGLAEYNDTWVIIDKEISHKCYEGVWTLILSQQDDFNDHGEFSKKVRDEWEKIYRQNENDMSWSKDQVFVDGTLPKENEFENKTTTNEGETITPNKEC